MSNRKLFPRKNNPQAIWYILSNVWIGLMVVMLSSISLSAQSPKDILGYDLKLSEIPNALLEPQNRTPVVAVLGFPDKPTMYAHKFDTEKTFTVTFSFHNNLMVTPEALNPLFLARCIRSIDLGQEHDAQSLLYVFLRCYRAGYAKIDVFANSRGCAAVLMALYMLSHTQENDVIWKKLGCDGNELDGVRTCLAKGSIFLAHPLLNHESALQQLSLAPVYPFLKIPGACFIKIALYWMLRLFLFSCTSFNYQQAQKLSPYNCLSFSIKSPDWSYKITIAIAEYELVVGDAHVIDVMDLAEQYPDKLICRRGGINHWDIRELLKDFRKTIML